MDKPKLPPDVLEYFRKQGARGGKKAAESMTPEARIQRARTASLAAKAARKGAPDADASPVESPTKRGRPGRKEPKV